MLFKKRRLTLFSCLPVSLLLLYYILVLYYYSTGTRLHPSLDNHTHTHTHTYIYIKLKLKPGTRNQVPVWSPHSCFSSSPLPLLLTPLYFPTLPISSTYYTLCSRLH
jgi:hypothetical protein